MWSYARSLAINDEAFLRAADLSGINDAPNPTEETNTFSAKRMLDFLEVPDDLCVNLSPMVDDSDPGPEALEHLSKPFPLSLSSFTE